jgi:hypothetical protein
MNNHPSGTNIKQKEFISDHGRPGKYELIPDQTRNCDGRPGKPGLI